ncbi:MAG: polyribonucleotide nucleotidyltransferase [Candidatus Midichloriaceae bacterium]
MFNIVKKSIEWNGKNIELETGKIARQANASVVVRMGKSTVLCTVTFSKKLKEGIDFFPLSVNYLEKYYAAGRFPGGFIKREGKPSDREALISRLIDRPIRPLFPADFLHEVSVICKVLSYDGDSSPDILAIIGTAAALKISELPFDDLLAATKIGLVDDEFVFNPSIAELEKSELDLVIAGTTDSVLMIESSAKEIDEEKLVSAIEFAHKNIQPVIKLIDEFTADSKKDKYDYNKLDIETIFGKLKKEFNKDVKSIYEIVDKGERKEKLDVLYKKALDNYSTKDGFELNVFDLAYKKLKKEVVRGKILDNNIRIDGRNLEEIRKIDCEIGLLPQTHGSSLFTRGETQSLSIVTLGSLQDSQLRDDITGTSNERFMLHYNFPPYSVGEVGMLRPPGRREIGHGKLALKAVAPILPKDEKFPYTVRVVSEITESNGSSSMATVCAATLALMDAGVPIKTPVAGIAMGLILEKDRHAILSDIIGDEDALGDMDFKVASTKDGITALQMDIKVNGITIEIMKKAISQAKDGCNHILSKINELISKPKDELNSSAPRISSIKINKDKIRDLIGPGGKNIKDICERTGVKIDIEDDGNVKIFAADEVTLKEALSIIEEVVAVPEVGKIYSAKITKIMQFGGFARFLGATEGLVHVSEISDRNIENVDDIFSEGMIVNVKYVGTDHKGKIKLTMKNVDQSDEFLNQDSWKKLMESEPKKQRPEKKNDQDFVRKKRVMPRDNRSKTPNYNKAINPNNHNKSSKEEKNPPLFNAKSFIKKLFN